MCARGALRPGRRRLCFSFTGHLLSPTSAAPPRTALSRERSLCVPPSVAVFLRLSCTRVCAVVVCLRLRVLVPVPVCRSLPGVEESEEYGAEQQDVIESEEIDFA